MSILNSCTDQVSQLSLKDVLENYGFLVLPYSGTAIKYWGDSEIIVEPVSGWGPHIMKSPVEDSHVRINYRPRMNGSYMLTSCQECHGLREITEYLQFKGCI